ncbi:hypothetical protein KFL_002550200 [Klebsormidium nitens]|uniref:NADP-dependent oxidoreductase domain-containing protein n=1 Tax=Klebsormidium nitens TaxID=105231 RepID=A0A1Y1I5P1_KLENI|nr:hypothetical protein KFL_002550200 [Klebsormidium nitens]|eukprot:GAQ85813.1 hypothetical protein KFL_002550200 [Klebsormidium nitens]
MAVPTITFSNGKAIPAVGLGVWRAEKDVLASTIAAAIDAGYRHFDCAADYGNEAEVGAALAGAIESGRVTREELFITTKLWNSDHGHVAEALEQSLKNLRLTYVDLYLVHFPIATKHTGIGVGGIEKDGNGVMILDTSVSLEQTWRHMEAAVDAGKARSIGVSNYDVFLVRDLLSYARIPPATNQIETHPYFQRDSLVRLCLAHGIAVTAHTPLGGGQANADLFGSASPLDDPAILELARKYNKTPAQIVLRWGLERQTIVIPKSTKPDRIKENIDSVDFSLTPEDMARIKKIDRNKRSNDPQGAWGIDIYA